MNILTIDVEEIYHLNFPEIEGASYPRQPRVRENLKQVLSLLKEKSQRATFFVLGEIAEAFPQVVKEIREEGHEVASHGYHHRLIYEMSPEEFRKELRISLRILEDITGEKVLGFRAPSWSITTQSLWALKILEEEGLIYDSSIFPTSNFLYGIEGMDPYPHRIGKIWEFPPSTLPFFWKRIPVGGGFYLRVLPLWFLNISKKYYKRKGVPFLLYFHTWEISPHFSPLPLTPTHRFIRFHNLKFAYRKLEKILEREVFLPIKEFLTSWRK